MSDIRAYRETDLDAARRIWIETGWIEADKPEEMDRMLAYGQSLVGLQNGEAECLVINAPGTMRHLDADVPLAGVMGVTTSRVARKQGLAGRVTAAAIAESVRRGAIVAALGMFEQGYYDRLGFGTGGDEHFFEFDPARLRVPGSTRLRPPARLAYDEYEAVHASRVGRRRGHGFASFDDPRVTQASLGESNNGFGLGYRDGPGGAISHHLWMGTKGGGAVEEGPYTIQWFAAQTDDQLRELLAVVKSLEDQVRLVRTAEPPELQLQTLLEKPLAPMWTTRHGKFETRYRVFCWWQARICDLPACLASTRLPDGEVRFNLELTDPIERYLDPDAPWRGVGGTYVVSLGPESRAEPGRDADLPTLRTTVNAFTRLWLGVRRPRELAITDPLDAPPELLGALDEVVRLPRPHIDWDF